MDKLDISILDKDGKPLNVGEPEIQQVGEKDGVPQYVLVYKGKIQKYQNQSIITFQYMTFINNSCGYKFLNSDKVPPAQQGKARQVQVGIKDNGGIQKQENIVSNFLLIFMLNSKRHLFVGTQ